MIATQVRPRWSRALVMAARAASLALALGVLVEAWPAPVPLRAPIAVEPPEVTTYLPFRGYGWRDLGEERCLAFLTEWAQRPGWTLRLEHGTTGCLGDYIVAGLAVTPDGRAAWIDEGGRERSTVLREREFAELLAAALDSCSPAPSDDDGREGRMASHLLRVSWTGRTTPDLRLWEGPVVDRLAAVIERVGDGYRDARLRDRGPFSIGTRVQAESSPWFWPRSVALTIDDTGQLVVRSGSRRGRSALDHAELVSALDWIELDGAELLRMPHWLTVRVRRILDGDPG